MKHELCSEKVRKYFVYEPLTGKLKNRVSRGTRAKEGAECGCISTGGSAATKKAYLRIIFEKRNIYVHRLIWVYMTGKNPEYIDHIDGNGLNNKWENLRSVSHRINLKNQKVHSTNTSGHTGVCYRKDSGKWRARIMVDDKMISLGDFSDKEAAIQARKQTKIKYGVI